MHEEGSSKSEDVALCLNHQSSWIIACLDCDHDEGTRNRMRRCVIGSLFVPSSVELNKLLRGGTLC